uniref:Uncharacterized protein n=1 Tax=Anguilla anguilla TaxID=7936 RepID=A0A0E9VPT6_ANGAN
MEVREPTTHYQPKKQSSLHSKEPPKTPLCTYNSWESHKLANHRSITKS